MKKYIIPEIKISGFDVEDVITDSTAVGQVTNTLKASGVNDTIITTDWVKDWQAAE